MSVKPRHAEVLVVGAGPAGMAAATAAANHGRKVLVLDDNSHAGGQIWRAGVADVEESSQSRAKARRKDAVQANARAAFGRSSAELLPGRRVVDAPQRGLLRAVVDTEHGSAQESFTWDRLIVATGTRERFLPFPGWTLPGVFGAGGLQALVKGGYSVAGKRVVVAGSGPLLLAVASHLEEFGATVVSIAEQATVARLLPFATSLLLHPAKLREGLRYRARLARVPYRTGWWPAGVEQRDTGLTVRLIDGKRSVAETCDLLACGFHLVGNTELAELLGCKLTDDVVEVNEQQQTSVDGVYCAGEPTGIAGLDAVLVQGEIAGLAAAGEERNTLGLRRRRAKEAAFGRRLNRAFRLRTELASLSSPETVVCRCEDVTFARLQEHGSWTEAKLQTRCGMGPCQARICGPAVGTMFGWRANSVRPPIFPVPIAAFADDGNDSLEQRNDFQETT